MERINKRWQKVDDLSKCGYINLMGYTSAYESINTALNMAAEAKSDADSTKKLVLFVICI